MTWNLPKDPIQQDNWPHEMTLHIANGASVTEVVSLGPLLPCGIIPVAGTEGTSLTFNAGGNATIASVVDNGTELEIAFTAATFVPIDYTKFAGAMRLQVRTGTLASPTAQTGATTLTLLLRRM